MKHLITTLIAALFLALAVPGAAQAQTTQPTITYRVTLQHGGSVGPASYTTSPKNAAAIGGIIGNAYSPTGSGYAQINLTRKECYVFFCTTDYQAHLKVNWSWNVVAYGGVVFNVTKSMWADHKKATFKSDPPTYTESYFTYHSHYGNTSSMGGYQVDGVMDIQQCIPGCVQTETVVAYIHAHDDGSYIEDINHS